MSLFNPRTIERVLKAKPFEPSEAQLTAAGVWAESLSSGKLQSENETALYGAFRQRILHEILGYSGITDVSGNETFTAAEHEKAGAGSVEFALGQFSAEERQIVAPLELKDAHTDLDAIMPGRHKTPVQQAWEYAADIPGAKWVLVGNYVELRLYAFGYGRNEYEVWKLERLNDPDELARFHLLLSADNLLSGKTHELLKESAREDREITDSLYEDYKKLRANLIQTISDQNTSIAGEDAISHAQKILDRVLFIAFAEDTDLLPRNTLQRAFEARNEFNPQPVWKNFKGLFRQIDRGYKHPEGPALSIPAYNGGLFAEDSALDALTISDLVCEGFRDLGAYAYESEVSANVLGHVFEQSVSDIEAMRAEARGEEAPQISKKKREGVIYTPDYVTRFIVEQTLGRYLQEQFLEVLKQYSHEKSFPEPGQKIDWHNRTNAERDFLLAYQKILFGVKVLDPACGSGAFLIAAFDFLESEYDRVNRRLARPAGEGMGTIFDPHTAILTQNLYGVDVNIESVEITKLSLWLRTAKRGQPLQSLRANIRVGNSLIEESDYHHRAFAWRDAFPEIFEQGGFHIVMGNPPYVRMELIKPFKPYLEKRYEVVSGRADLYCYFYELGFRLLREGGKLGFISSSTFFRTGAGAPLRRYLSEKANLEAVVDFGDFQLFKGVTTYPAIVTMAKPEKDASQEGSLHFLNIKPPLPQDLTIHFAKHAQPMARSRLGEESWQFESDELAALRQKIREGKPALGEVYGAPLRGIVTGLNNAFIVNRETRDRLTGDDPKSADLLVPFLKGEDLKKWRVESQDLWLINIPKNKIGIEDYPAVMNYLLPFKERLEKRATKQE